MIVIVANRSLTLIITQPIVFFRVLWPCIMNVGWRERDQQDATNLMFIIRLLSQHVSGIIMPVIRRTYHQENIFRASLCPSKFISTFSPNNRHNDAWKMFSWWWVLLIIGIMMPETCWDKSLIINIRVVASCWFLSLEPIDYLCHDIKNKHHRLLAMAVTAPCVRCGRHFMNIFNLLHVRKCLSASREAF